jgi:hypothetical protein
MDADPEPIDHRRLAASLFNRTWELLDQGARSSDEDVEMLTAAFTSRFHWLQVGGPRNFCISDWQVSRVAAVLGHATLAAEYGRRSLQTASREELGPFYVAYAHEALARAARIVGNDKGRQEHLDAAYGLLERIEDSSERDLLAPDLDELRR